MEAITLPAKWQEWKIVEAIGEGSFGTVYRAEKDDGVVKSVSAIKVVEIAADDSRMAGLNRRYRSEEAVRDYLWSVVDHCAEEIRTMYRLQGESSIVSIQDHAIEELKDRVGWRLFIRMEYLQSFDDYLTTHEFSQRDIIRMGISLCGALEKCEKLNILHRDIKPENIFVSSSGEFKLGDFGISRVLEETRASLTSEGTMGTMAPEAYKGQPCGKEADIYSLGLVLYTLANRGCEPFIDTEKQMPSYGEMQTAFERRMKGEPLPPPAEASPALQRALLKACAYKPSARYRSAAEFRAALEPLAKEKKRPPLKRIALAAALALLAAAAVVLFVPGVRLRLFPVRYESAGIRFTIPVGFAKQQAGDGNARATALMEEYNGYPAGDRQRGETEPLKLGGSEAALRAWLKRMRASETREQADEVRRQEFLALYRQCQEVVAALYQDDSYAGGDRRDWKPEDVGPSDIERVLCDGMPRTGSGNLQKMSQSMLNRQFQQRRLTRQRLDLLLKGELAIERFDLITLGFLVSSQREDEDAAMRLRRYMDDMNAALARCGMMKLYPVNPYEAFCMMCLLADMPLLTYYDVWEMSYSG